MQYVFVHQSMHSSAKKTNQYNIKYLCGFWITNSFGAMNNLVQNNFVIIAIIGNIMYLLVIIENPIRRRHGPIGC